MKTLLTGTVGLVFLAALVVGSFERGVRAFTELVSDTAVAHALDTSVRIVMYAPQPANNGTYLVEYGLGTLVNQGSQTVIVTHDHWSVFGGMNWWFGKDDFTFFGQFEKNTNVFVGARWAF